MHDSVHSYVQIEELNYLCSPLVVRQLCMKECVFIGQDLQIHCYFLFVPDKGWNSVCMGTYSSFGQGYHYVTIFQQNVLFRVLNNPDLPLVTLFNKFVPHR